MKTRLDLQDENKELASVETKGANAEMRERKSHKNKAKQVLNTEEGKKSVMDFIFSGKGSDVENPLDDKVIKEKAKAEKKKAKEDKPKVEEVREEYSSKEVSKLYGKTRMSPSLEKKLLETEGFTKEKADKFPFSITWVRVLTREVA